MCVVYCRGLYCVLACTVYSSVSSFGVFSAVISNTHVVSAIFSAIITHRYDLQSVDENNSNDGGASGGRGGGSGGGGVGSGGGYSRGQIQCCDYADQNQLIASGHRDGTVRLWRNSDRAYVGVIGDGRGHGDMRGGGRGKAGGGASGGVYWARSNVKACFFARTADMYVYICEWLLLCEVLLGSILRSISQHYARCYEAVFYAPSLSTNRPHFVFPSSDLPTPYVHI
jgi:hypothetical protein